MNPLALSVIIPTLNEAVALPETLAHTFDMIGDVATEIIVSDCGSTDGTGELALRAGARLVTGGTSRATAQNIGARAARGSVLLFLHADCKVPERFDINILAAMQRTGVVGGAFDFNWMSHPLNHGMTRQMLRMVRIMNRVRFRWTGNFYGDQGIFVAAETFRRLGGFPEIRLMEDLRFSQKLKHAGRMAILRPCIKTSPRRFLTRGVVYQFFHDLSLLGRDACGLSCPQAWESYNRLNRTAEYRTKKRTPSKEVEITQLSHSSVVDIKQTPHLSHPVSGGCEVVGEVIGVVPLSAASVDVRAASRNRAV